MPRRGKPLTSCSLIRCAVGLARTRAGDPEKLRTLTEQRANCSRTQTRYLADNLREFARVYTTGSSGSNGGPPYSRVPLTPRGAVLPPLKLDRNRSKSRWRRAASAWRSWSRRASSCRRFSKFRRVASYSSFCFCFHSRSDSAEATENNQGHVSRRGLKSPSVNSEEFPTTHSVIFRCDNRMTIARRRAQAYPG